MSAAYTAQRCMHMKQTMKDALAVVLFLLLFPYFAMSFWQQKHEEATPENDSLQQEALELTTQLSEGAYFVYWEKEQKKIPSELFLVGALAGSIDSTYETEALKAQAVMLRSSLFREMQQEDTKLLKLTTADSSYLSVAEQKKKWGDDYAEKEKKLLEAVSQTKGVVAMYEGMPVMGCYHGMSAGATRDGTELSDTYGYLKRADCSKDLSAASYLQTTKRRKEQVGELDEASVKKDTQGYVIELVRNGEKVSGESLREELQLPSSNFTWEEKNGSYIFTTKGIGHGFGYDQYYGNLLAQQGHDYQEILDYFYQNITFDRME